MNLSYWIRQLKSLIAWPYGPKISEHQRHREMFMTRMWTQPTEIGTQLCGLGVQYINALEATEEVLTKRWDLQEERMLEQFCRDLRQRVTLIDMATHPNVTGVSVTLELLEGWQWDDDLRFAMNLPNEQYAEIRKTTEILRGQMAHRPA